MTQQHLPILVLGYANVDVIARVDRLPGRDDRVTADQVLLVPGGMAANCACAAAALGGHVMFFGSVGQDSFGELVHADFERFGVKTEWVTSTNRTTLAIISVTPNGDRSIISEPLQYIADELRQYLSAFSGHPGILYLDGYHLGVAAEEVRKAKQRGFTTFCDLDGALDTYSLELILQHLESTDIVLWNRKLSSTMFPDLAVGVACRQLLDIVPLVIHTHGGEDVLVFTRETSSRFKVPTQDTVVDTTGAGDVFAGAFLSRHAQGYSLQQAIHGAVSAAAFSVRYPGAREGLTILPPMKQQS